MLECARMGRRRIAQRGGGAWQEGDVKAGAGVVGGAQFALNKQGLIAHTLGGHLGIAEVKTPLPGGGKPDVRSGCAPDCPLHVG